MNEPRAGGGGGPRHRAGFVALLGPPNCGKSTLLNRLMKQKLAIVSRKPQTTRSRILGILSRPNAQFLLLDTPGRHSLEGALNRTLNGTVDRAVRDCDLAVLLLDPLRGWQKVHSGFATNLDRAGKPYLLAASKLDLVPSAVSVPLDGAGSLMRDRILRFSGLTGEGVPELLQAAESLLPPSPPLYPEDELTDRPLRWLCGELIREALFECLDQELPYAMAVDIQEFDESRVGRVRVVAHLLVQTRSQKRIAVGKQGQTVKRIGIRARRELERFLDTRVDLSLTVREEARWTQSARRLHQLGYD